MGFAVLIGLVMIALVIFGLIAGYMIYGICLGLAAFGRMCARVWRGLTSEDADSSEEMLAKADPAAVGEPGGQREGSHCWEVKGCPPTVRESCPAYRRPDLPCWLAFIEDSPESRLKPECLTCKQFNLTSLAA